MKTDTQKLATISGCHSYALWNLKRLIELVESTGGSDDPRVSDARYCLDHPVTAPPIPDNYTG